MKQIIFVHGGSRYPDNDAFCEALKTWEYKPFTTRKRWITRIQEQLERFQVFVPQMPNFANASYKAWKIWFEKWFSFFNEEDLILIGHSLGWQFLIKYLSENILPKHINQLHLVSTIIDNRDRSEER